MKKIVTAILLFLFVATAANSTEFHKTKTTIDEEHSEKLSKKTPEIPDENDKDSDFRLFRSFAFSLGSRPPSGRVIGQEGGETPVGDGLSVLVVCCILWGIKKQIKKPYFTKARS